MALANYRVEYEDGSEMFFQFDPETDAGKEGLDAYKAQAKKEDSPIKSVARADSKA